MERLQHLFVLGGRYRLAERIARGGMGEVWSAHDLVLERPVAVKVLNTFTARERALAARFRDEARLAAKLQSRHIVEVYDFGEEEGLSYLVMELLPGTTAANEIASKGALPPDEVSRIVADTAKALATAHEAGVIHRDVKPSNILLTHDGDWKLADFGIARALDGASHTRTGEMFGTPQYLSPEMARGEPATPASDLYCLGIVAHEMLTGARPFDKPTPIATALAHVQEPPPPLPDSVPQPLAGIVDACLAKDPADRPASGREIAEALSSDTRVEPASGSLPTLDTSPGSVQPTEEALGPRGILVVSLVALIVVACLAAMVL